MNERWIKASEFGEYVYCQRAWWYRLQGAASQNAQELSHGAEWHTRHGWGLRLVTLQRFFAYALIALAILLLFMQIVQ